jgi:hypothetical protein
MQSIVNGINQVLIPKAPAAAAAAAPAKTGRHLLGFGWGASAGSTYAEDASENAIYQATLGVGSAASAAATSSALSSALAVPGAINDVASGECPALLGPALGGAGPNYSAKLCWCAITA